MHVTFALLKKEIRECLFRFDQLSSETKSYLSMFSERLIITSDNVVSDYHDNMEDIYTQMSNKHYELKNQGLKSTAINEVLKKDVDDYFNSILKNIHKNTTNIKTLYRIIDKDVVDTAQECAEFARHQLTAEFDDNFLFGLCFHINALLNRSNTNPVMPDIQISKIKKEHPKEYAVGEEMIKKLERRFNIDIPIYEQGFLALLLTQNPSLEQSKNLINIVIVCHGETTASSMAAVANTLLNTSWMKAIDMPLTVTIDETYNKLRATVTSVNQGKGLFLLVDMGSLVDFGTKLTEETGIPVKVIPAISTPLAIEVLRKVLYKEDDIDAIYESLQEPVSKKDAFINIHNKKPAILSVCITGKGSSKMMEDILAKLIYPKYRHVFEIVVMNHLDVKKEYPKMQAMYNFIAAVGNINPKIENVPFFPIGQIMDKDGQQTFFEILNANLPLSPEPFEVEVIDDTYSKASEILSEYVKYLNPKIAIEHIKVFIGDIGYKNISRENTLNMIVHLGCMLERCIQKDSIYFENIRQFKKDNMTLFAIVRREADVLESEYEIKINDDEVAYIVQIINAHNNE